VAERLAATAALDVGTNQQSVGVTTLKQGGRAQSTAALERLTALEKLEMGAK
jgi:hypothetical protein